MNILLINHYAGSHFYGMEYRPYYIAKEWVKQGHNVTILAASYSHLRQSQPNVSKDFQEEIIDGIKYIWIRTPIYKSSLARIMNIMSFALKLYVNAKKISRLCSPNVVIASSTYPLDNIPACKIANNSNAKFIYEVHDIWPLSPKIIGGYSQYHPYIVLMQWAENFAYRNCDKVVSLLWNSEQHMLEHGLEKGKFICIPNGYNPEEWSEDKFDMVLPVEHSQKFEVLKDKIIVGFAGGFAPSGALMTLMEVARLLKNETILHFVLVGKGPDESKIRNFMEEHDLKNVSILPAVAKKMIPAINSKFDISYMGGVHSILHQYGTSYNKMTDYMLSGKPIIHAIDEPNCLSERIGCGIQVEAENPRLISKAIINLCRKNRTELKIMGMKGRLYAIENLKWSILSKRFIDSI